MCMVGDDDKGNGTQRQPATVEGRHKDDSAWDSMMTDVEQRN